MTVAKTLRLVLALNVAVILLDAFTHDWRLLVANVGTLACVYGWLQAREQLDAIIVALDRLATGPR